MKKSDAARKLHYLVRNAQSHSSDPLKNMLVLLDDIEIELGMLPQKTSYTIPSTMKCRFGSLIVPKENWDDPVDILMENVNEWEPEDKDESGS